MGYRTKAYKRRYQRQNERIIALAVLAGFVARKCKTWRPPGGSETAPIVYDFWAVEWPDGKIGHFDGRTAPALMYLCMCATADTNVHWLNMYNDIVRHEVRRAVT